MNEAHTNPTLDQTTCDQCRAIIFDYDYIYVTNAHRHPRHRKVICYDCMAKRGRAYKVTYETITGPPPTYENDSDKI